MTPKLKSILGEKLKSKSIFVVILGLFIFSVLIFQNCGRIKLASDLDNISTFSSRAAGQVAEDIISTMDSAGLKDENEFDETIDYIADSMTCGTKFQSTEVECIFLRGQVKAATKVATAAIVKDYLSGLGISPDCPTCNETVSYTARNIKCTRVLSNTDESVCTFTK